MIIMKGDQRYEPAQIEINLARLKVSGDRFEIVIEPDKTLEYLEGKIDEVRETLRYSKIFADAQKGMLASEKEMIARFKTSDPLAIAEIILKKGQIQFTATFRDKKRAALRQRIIDIIHRNGVDPQTGLPHPIKRIERAIEEARARIDETKRAEDQIQTMLKKIMPVLPIRFETRKLEVRIPSKYASKHYSLVKNFGPVSKAEWKNDGSLVCQLQLPAGLQQEFYDALNKATHGSAETRVL